MTAVGRRPADLLLSWTRNLAMFRRWALAAIVVNVGLVVTGGAVRLSASGLGCPTWPRCTDDSLTPTSEYAVHGKIEFTNRLLISVVSVVVIVTLVIAIRLRRQILLAALLTASVPAQAVLGGISVLTKLNPWVVASHFLMSMVIIALAYALWWGSRAELRPPASAPPGSAAAASLRAGAWAALVLTAAVVMVGTVVTGSGPHSGAQDSTHRMHFAPSSVAQLHADLVMLLIGVSVGYVLLTRIAGSSALRRAALWLLGIELAQALIGFVQYFTHVPAVLVGVHMFGATLVWLAALQVLAVAVSLARVPESVPVPALVSQRA